MKKKTITKAKKKIKCSDIILVFKMNFRHISLSIVIFLSLLKVVSLYWIFVFVSSVIVCGLVIISIFLSSLATESSIKSNFDRNPLNESNQHVRLGITCKLFIFNYM